MKFEAPPHRVLLFRGRGIASALIRWQTRCKYSHAALWDGHSKTAIESWVGKGVREITITDWEGITPFLIESMSEAEWRKALGYARKQIGKKYDWRGVLRFITRSSRNVSDRLFCSELVFEAIHRGDVRLLKTDAYRVAPGHLEWSPFMSQAASLGP